MPTNTIEIDAEIGRKGETAMSGEQNSHLLIAASSRFRLGGQMIDDLLLPNGISQGLFQGKRLETKKFIEGFFVAGTALQKHGDLISC